MVVEDDFIIATGIQAALSAAGHEVLALVPTAERALALKAHPEVVIMDVRPAGEMDGIEAARRLRRRFRCAVIFHTAHADPEHETRMLAIGHASVVPKPAKFTRLIEAVSAAPRGSQ